MNTDAKAAAIERMAETMSALREKRWRDLIGERYDEFKELFSESTVESLLPLAEAAYDALVEVGVIEVSPDTTRPPADQAGRWEAAAADCALERRALRGLVADLREGLAASQISHKYVDDCWYSCPKAEDGCCDDSQGDECNCGADAWNARLADLLARSAIGEKE